MVSFEGFAPEDGVPIYVQIMRHIKRGIASGALKSGDELPSRRALSVMLGVNPNTVQKAYRLLEEERAAESRPGAGSRLLFTPEKAAEIRRELTESVAGSLTEVLKSSGLALGEALKLVERLWREREKQ